MFLLGYTLRQFDLRTITKVARAVQHLRRKKFTLDGNGPLSRMPGIPLIPILSATPQHSSSDMDSGVAGSDADEFALRHGVTDMFRRRCGNDADYPKRSRPCPGWKTAGCCGCCGKNLGLSE